MELTDKYAISPIVILIRPTINSLRNEIDNRDIVEFDPDRLFEMLGNIAVNIEKIVSEEQNIILELTHNGYKNLTRGSQVHTRIFHYCFYF